MRNAEMNVDANYIDSNLDQQVTHQVSKMAGRGAKFHHAILRFGDTIYENLRETAGEVQEEIIKVEEGYRKGIRPASENVIGYHPAYTSADAEASIARYKHGMEIVEIQVGQPYHHFGDGKRMRTHGEDDGFHGSKTAGL